MHRMPKTLLFLLAAVLGHVAGGCAITVPELAATIESKYGIHPNTEVARYVSQTGNQMVSALGASEHPYTFIVLNSEDCIQLSVPVNRANGGLTGERRVYVTSGLLRELDNGAQLRSALALEIALQEAGHVRRAFNSFVREQTFRQLVSEVGRKLFQRGDYSNSETLSEAIKVLGESGVLDAKGQYTYRYDSKQLQAADEIALRSLMDSDYDASQYDQFLEDLQLEGVASSAAFGGLQVTVGRRDAVRSLLTDYVPIRKKVDAEAYRQRVLERLED